MEAVASDVTVLERWTCLFRRSLQMLAHDCVRARWVAGRLQEVRYVALTETFINTS